MLFNAVANEIYRGEGGYVLDAVIRSAFEDGAQIDGLLKRTKITSTFVYCRSLFLLV